jgi:hypothetical protein
VLVTVRASGALADEAREIMDDHGAVDIDTRVSTWRERGWTGYSNNAEPYTEDEYRQERSYYTSSDRRDLGDRVGDTMHRTGDKMERMGDKVENKMRRAGDKIENAMDRAGDKIEDKMDRSGDRMRYRGSRIYDRP